MSRNLPSETLRAFGGLGFVSAVSLGLLVAGCSPRIVAEPDPAVLSGAQALLKKVDVLFFEIAGVANPSSSAKKKSSTRDQHDTMKDINKQWDDVVSDADVIQANACQTPNNQDVCIIASGLYTILSDDKQSFEANPSAFDAKDNQSQARQQLGLLIHAEKYKQLASSQGGGAK